MLIGRPLLLRSCCCRRLANKLIATAPRRVPAEILRISCPKLYSTDREHNGDINPSTVSHNGRGEATRTAAAPIVGSFNLPPEIADDIAFDESWIDDDLRPPSSRQSTSKWVKPTDEEVLHLIDKRQRELASHRAAPPSSNGPPTSILEDASRYLLQELLEKELTDRKNYKKPVSDAETTSDIQLLQRVLDISASRIHTRAKPGHHSLPFYLHRNSKRLDKALQNVLRKGETGMVNKVCYNLLVSPAAPTIKTFNILLRRFTRLRMTSLARVILTTLFAVGFEPNPQTYASVLHYFTIIGNYDAFGKAVTIMRNTFVDFRNPILGAAELNGWSKFGDFMSMRRRLRLLQEEGLRDNIFILAIELRYFAKRHMWEGGLPALRLLLAKKVEDVDHRALFWAFKLCVNCQQYDFAERLKTLVQEKRWPVEALWMRPERTRGLPFGYKGKDSGQVIPKRSDAAQWKQFWDSGGRQQRRAMIDYPPEIRIDPKVPEDWYEYSAVWREDVKEEDIIMESRIGRILSNQSEGKDQGDNSNGGDEAITSVDSKLASLRVPVKSTFKKHSEATLFKSIVESRKKALLGTKG
ncbi:hypothetical protein TWF694_009212 [Orbilia ellipsospora]|uniref:Uncharacterized protein n=1 Tax=Orbilia ellipsospora TaxID=2528407 RepID=A0AAV9XE82_9PEZI